MTDVVALRRIRPPVHLVCGLYVVLVDDEWWIARMHTAGERRATGLWFAVVGGPEDDQQAAERCARRLALRPLAQPEESHGS